jgi:putative ABC transport system ATP-binding protein/macrolide transport system ATP-binding/permease protein/lipoprotein-releasing system ATP-binding protein
VLAAVDLTKIYPTRRGEITALSQLDLQIASGEFVAVCGHSGSGKSTLLAMLGGLCRPTRGSLTIDGTDLLALDNAQLADFRGQKIGFVFQFASLLSNLRAIDNVALPALIRGDSNYDAIYRRAREVLGDVGLAERWDAFPGELSGGQQRRVAIARALVNRPALILADEPTSDLDEQTEQEIFALLVSLQQAHRSTLILVTHRPELAQHADRTLYLRGGKLVSTVIAPIAARSVSVAQPTLDTAQSVPSPLSLTPEEPVALGAGLPRFLVDFAGWTLVVALTIFGLNYGAAMLQKKSLTEQQAARSAVEDLALQTLRADVEEVVEEPDGSYRLSLYLLNPDADRVFYVLGPTVRAFVQVDRSWQALNVSSVDAQPDDVTKIEGRRSFRFTFRAEPPTFDELIRGYMHIRITNSMIVAASAEPKSDLFDRTDDYYIYLRPRNVTEDEVRERNGWKPNSLVPRWIAMPAH